MQPISPKSFIEQLCETNGQNSDGGQRARDLNRHILTGFTSDGCFIQELLQNADDLDGDHSEIFFELNQKELIVYHHGAPFNQQNVAGISSYGDVSNNPKNKNIERSGYKDIGFKSVFRVAYRVDIWSNEWHFHFNENSEKWRNGGKRDKKYPWQIAPIWTEKSVLSNRAQKIVDVQKHTTFIFQLRNGSNIAAELDRLKSHPERILFLKKIRTINLSINSQINVITHRKDHILMNGNICSVWQQYVQSVDIPKDIKKYLKNLSSQECPERLKTSDKVTLSLCYSDHVQKLNVNFFSTLPTAEGVGLPFLVNAPFLLNPSRESLIQNSWNIFLI